MRVARSAPVQQARGAAALAAERPSARMLASLLSRTRTRRDVGGRHSPARLWCSARIADEIVDYCSVAMRESRAPDRGFGDCLRGRGASVEHCSSRPPSCVGSAGAPSRPETRGPGFRVRLPAVAPSGASAVLIRAMRAARAFTRSASTRSQRVGVLRRARLGARRPERPSRTSAGGSNVRHRWPRNCRSRRTFVADR